MLKSSQSCQSSTQISSQKNKQTRHNVSVYIFRRDLRIQDNTAFYQACSQSNSVICAFFVNPAQVGTANPYRGEKTLQFLYESLADLEQQLVNRHGKLHIFNGDWSTQLSVIYEKTPFSAVFVNEDYTPFSQKRDRELQNWCQTHKCAFESFEDYTLSPIKDICKPDGTAYSVFTPFAKKCQEQFFRPVLPDIDTIQPSVSFITTTYSQLTSAKQLLSTITCVSTLAVHPGTTHALALLQNIPALTQYGQTRNIPGVNGTTLLSPHLKFGTISIRQAYWAIRKAFDATHQLILELFWRDFFAYIGLHHPSVLGQEYQKKYRSLSWSFDAQHWNLFIEAKTGFPIVDAGIRQLRETGFMHNRVRMIVANFLIKDLHIDWRKGEQFFAQHLIDYDPLVNNGNWQWCAGTGCDAQPYYRIFNPWLQQQRFDADCAYIRRWIPELRDVSIEDIHSWNESYVRYATQCAYPQPIVDHSVESKKTLAWYKQYTTPSQ
jgi:deoxyribodipyrimidine photo-lyase